MNLLGLSFGYHDSAVAVLQDGRPAFFASEERYSYKKNDAGFPHGAVAAALSHTGCRPGDFDAVVYYEDPLLKLDRIGRMARMFHSEPERYLKGLLRRGWDRREQIDPIGAIALALDLPREAVHHVDHHHAHAALSYYLSPFDRAAVITLDGVGEHETMALYRGEGARLEKVGAMRMPDSVGLLYSFFTGFCGFAINEGEYKLMGLAAYGSPDYADTIRSWIDLNPASPRCSTPLLQWSVPTEQPYSEAFAEIFGEPFRAGRDDHLDKRFSAVAASIQLVLEEQLIALAGRVLGEWGSDALCLGGGVALNCNANGRLRREVTPKLFVPPAPGDAGSALGAAMAWHYRAGGKASLPSEKPVVPFTPYLGSELDVDRFREDFAYYAPLVDAVSLDPEELVETTADYLAAGEVVGWMQGRFEMGPRALGNRSILADPRTLAMKETVNRRIKNREPFRPFAPSVLKGREGEYFDLPSEEGLDELAPERFMLATHRIREDGKRKAMAVMHVDDTSRVHVVSRPANERFYDLIEAFARRTGVPILLNTSLNVAGRPMASDVHSGMHTLLNSEMDRLVVGNMIVSKRS